MKNIRGENLRIGLLITAMLFAYPEWGNSSPFAAHESKKNIPENYDPASIQKDEQRMPGDPVTGMERVVFDILGFLCGASFLALPLAGLGWLLFRKKWGSEESYNERCIAYNDYLEAHHARFEGQRAEIISLLKILAGKKWKKR